MGRHSRLAADSQRGAYYAIARLKLQPGADDAVLMKRIADDPRINLQAETEAQYYKDQSVVANQLRPAGVIVAIIMGIGAIFAAMNTMYASVSARITEIGTLRALGFTPGAVLGSIHAGIADAGEPGGNCGNHPGAAHQWVSRPHSATFMTFSTLSFNFRVTTHHRDRGDGVRCADGNIRWILPAWQAMRLSVVNALRRI